MPLLLSPHWEGREVSPQGCLRRPLEERPCECCWQSPPRCLVARPTVQLQPQSGGPAGASPPAIPGCAPCPQSTGTGYEEGIIRRGGKAPLRLKRRTWVGEAVVVRHDVQRRECCRRASQANVRRQTGCCRSRDTTTASRVPVRAPTGVLLQAREGVRALLAAAGAALGCSSLQISTG